ncbi:MAG: UDP-3-O-acyl-N-acetylglucosamine deacetylase, partial [Candidatus Omnitrophica bacterium]|nr:UDP-3-O-acyl-N-acetylglucosamine deacetylase [Candidatus Omnitrophota bacterium]
MSVAIVEGKSINPNLEPLQTGYEVPLADFIFSPEQIKGFRSFLLRVQNRTIACLTLYEDKAAAEMYFRIWLEKKLQNRKIGQKWLGILEDYFRARGIPQANSFWDCKENIGYHGFFEKHGFRVMDHSQGLEFRFFAIKIYPAASSPLLLEGSASHVAVAPASQTGTSLQRGSSPGSIRDVADSSSPVGQSDASGRGKEDFTSSLWTRHLLYELYIKATSEGQPHGTRSWNARWLASYVDGADEEARRTALALLIEGLRSGRNFDSLGTVVVHDTLVRYGRHSPDEVMPLLEESLERLLHPENRVYNPASIDSILRVLGGIGAAVRETSPRVVALLEEIKNSRQWWAQVGWVRSNAQMVFALLSKGQRAESLKQERAASRNTSSSSPVTHVQTFIDKADIVCVEHPVRKIIQENYQVGEINWIKNRKTKTGRNVYIVDSTKGAFLFTTIWKDYKPEQIGTMQRLARHLERKGFTKDYFVPQIIDNANGTNYVCFGDGFYYLRTYKYNCEVLDIDDGGSFYTVINIRQLRSAARMLARYHKAVEDFYLPQTDRHIRTIGALVSRAPKLRDLFDRTAAEEGRKNSIDDFLRTCRDDSIDHTGIMVLEGELNRLNDELSQAPIHGDFQPMNILFSGDEAVGAIDFEHSKYDLRLVDFIAGIFEMERGKPQVDEQRIEVFLDEYLKHNTLSMTELEALPRMLELNYLNRIAVALVERYESFQESEEYRQYIYSCADRVRFIRKFDWDGLIKAIKVRQIVSHFDWNEQKSLLRDEFNNSNTANAVKMLITILRSSTYTTGSTRILTMAEKMRIFSKALSLAIQTVDERETLLAQLDRELLEAPERYEPEALFLAHSYLNVAYAQVPKGTKVTTVVACQGEQDAIRRSDDRIFGREDRYIGDDDFLRVRIEQLADLYGVNSNFEWELILVGDGDDREQNDAAKQEKTIDIARRMVEDKHAESYQRRQIRILELSDAVKRKIKSQKGGATCLGMREALNTGATYIFFINAVAAYHAGQEGILLQELLYGADMAVASRKIHGALSKRSALRELKSVVYNWYLHVMLPWTLGFTDTQAGFKGFTRESLSKILPVNEAGVFNPEFDYGLSFDTDLISRYRILNKSVVQVPVARINFPRRLSRADTPMKILRMILGIAKQRLIFINDFRRKMHKEEDSGSRLMENKDTASSSPLSSSGFNHEGMYSYRMLPGENAIRIEGLSLHQGERTVMIIRKTQTNYNYIAQYVPLGLTPAIHGTIGYSALHADISGISTMEHLGSAIKATGLRGVDIRLYGTGCPILDGSSLGWIKMFEEAGWIQEENLHTTSYRIQYPVVLLRRQSKLGVIVRALKKLYHSGKVVKFFSDVATSLFPREGYDISPIKNIILPLEENQSHGHYIAISTLPYIPQDSMVAEFTYDSFDSYKRDLAPARTFLPLPLWEKQGEGVFMGALPGKNILTLASHNRNRHNCWSSQLIWPNEPARHKIMDLIGDIYLTEAEMGERIDAKGFFVCIGNGHRDNIEAGSVMKKSIELAKEGIGRPLMANITNDGHLEYEEYDPIFVLKELKKLHKKGYISLEVYQKIAQRISAIPQMAPAYNLMRSVKHVISPVIMVTAKLVHTLNKIFGIATRINNSRARNLEQAIIRLGADELIFADSSYVGGISSFRSDGKVYLSDWLLEDTDYQRYRFTKGAIAAFIAGCNYLLKEALIKITVFMYLKPLLKHSATKSSLEGSTLITTEQNPSEALARIEKRTKNFMERYNHDSWRKELSALINDTINWQEVCKIITVLSERELIEEAVRRGVLSYADYESVLAKACSLGFEKITSAEERQMLGSAIKNIGVSSPLAPEADKTLQSYTNIATLKEPLFVSVLFGMYKEQKRILPVQEGGLDFLRLKIEQLEDLAKINKNFKWELVMVNDGDDKQYDATSRNQTSLEVALKILTQEYPQYLKGDNTGNVRLFMLPQSMREKIGSRKGGAIMYGIWQRLQQARQYGDRPDVFVITDADITVPLSFIGLGIPRVLAGDVGMIIGSAQKDTSDIRRESGFSQKLYQLYNRIVQLRLKELRGITDTLMGFKVARAGILEEILPFPMDCSSLTHPQLDATFVPRMAFDEDMLCRIRIAGHRVEEVAVTWVKCKDEAFRLWDRARAFIDILWNVPRDVKFWRNKYISEVESWLANTNSYQRWHLVKEKVGPAINSDKAATFLWFLVGKLVYQRRAIKRYLKRDTQDAHGHITRQERVSLIGHALSLFLRNSSGDNGYDIKRLEWLRSVRQERSNELLPEAKLIIDSYLKTCEIRANCRTISSPAVSLPESCLSARKIKVAMISHLFSAGRKVLTDRLAQMKDLVCLNPDIEWIFYWVTQKDANKARGFIGSFNEAQLVLRAADEDLRGQVRFVDVPHEELALIQSVKGGSVVIGMAESIGPKVCAEQKPDYVLYSDMSVVPHLSQAGAILKSLIDNDNTIAIGSRRLAQSVGRRTWFRRLFSYILNKWVWRYHKALRSINDSQAGLKGFTRAQLEKILPVKINQDGERHYDLNFDYGLSFEVALMARAVRAGYTITEIPLVDTFEMSPRFEEHLLVHRYGIKMKNAIAVQAKAVEPFDGVWQFLGQGGECQVFSHPSLEVVLSVPRHTNSFIHAFLTSGGDIAKSTGKSMAMKIASLCLKIKLMREFFYWYLHHAMPKDRAREKKRLNRIKDTLGGFVVPFKVVERPQFDAVYSCGHSLRQAFKHAVLMITFPLRWSIGKCLKFTARKILESETSLSPQRFAAFSAFLQAPIIIIVDLGRFLLNNITLPIARWFALREPFRGLILFIKDFIKFNKPGTILTIVVKVAKRLNKVFSGIFHFTMSRTQLVFDHVPFVSVAAKRIDIATRPLWKLAFAATDVLGNLSRCLLPLRLTSEYAIFKKKLVSFGDVLLRLDRDTMSRVESLKEAKHMVDRFIEFEKELWTRRAFDHESHLLGDIGMSGEGKLYISDLGVITFELREAISKLRPENEGLDFMTQEVLRSAMSAELYDYYIKRVKEEVTEENILRLWGAKTYLCEAVPDPTGIPENSFVATPQEIFAAGAFKKIASASSPLNARAPEYLDTTTKKETINIKVLLRALRRGGWQERKNARLVVETAANILSGSMYVKERILLNQKIDWREAFSSIPEATSHKEFLKLYFNPDLIAGTEVEFILLNNILDGYIARGLIDECLKESALTLYGYVRPGIQIGARNAIYNETIPFFEFRRGKEETMPQGLQIAVVNRGRGRRQGLLTIQAGTKGDILLLGKHLKEWSARSSQRIVMTVKDEQRRPVLFSPADIIYLAPLEEERQHLENALVSDAAVVFFSPQDKRLNEDLSRPFAEEVAELLFEALLKIPFVGNVLVHKLIVPYLRNQERRALIEAHGGYDFPATWAVRRDVVTQAMQIFNWWGTRSGGSWWIALRLPLRVRETFWRSMGRFLGKEDADWLRQRELVRDFVTSCGGAQARTIVHPWMDCNTPLDIFNIYRSIVNKADLSWCRRLRQTFEIEENADVIDSVVTLDQIKPRANFFINASRIAIAQGVNLILGNNVVIDNSTLVIEGNPGETVFIPDGTVIAYSTIRGTVQEFNGAGRENFLHGFYSDSGFSFIGDSQLFVSLVRSGSYQPEAFSQEYEFTESDNIGLPLVAEIDRENTDALLKRQYTAEPLRNKSPPGVQNETMKAQQSKDTRKEPREPKIKIYEPSALPENFVFVTGATGFIGSHLCETLAKGGMAVAYAVRPNSTNLSNLPQLDNIYAVEIDLNNPDYRTLRAVIEKSSCVYHLAALGNQALTMDFPAEAYATNALSTAIIAALCAEFNKRLIFSSTFVVYDFSGRKEGQKVDEALQLPASCYPRQINWLDEAEKAFGNYVDELIAKEGKMEQPPLEFVGRHLLINSLPPAPDKRMLGANYPLSKLLAERLVLRYKAISADKTALVVRLNNIYGPRQPQETMVPLFIRGLFALRGDSKFFVWPTRRNLLYVDELVSILRVLEKKEILESERIINVAHDTDISTVGLANTIAQLLGIQPVVVADKRRRPMPAYKLDNARMKRLSGIETFLPLEEGLRATIEHYVSEYVAGCTPEHLFEVLRDEFGAVPVTVYQIVNRKRYSDAAVLRALRILDEKGLIIYGVDGKVNTYTIANKSSSSSIISDFLDDQGNIMAGLFKYREAAQMITQARRILTRETQDPRLLASAMLVLTIDYVSDGVSCFNQLFTTRQNLIEDYLGLSGNEPFSGFEALLSRAIELSRVYRAASGFADELIGREPQGVLQLSSVYARDIANILREFLGLSREKSFVELAQRLVCQRGRLTFSSFLSETIGVGIRNTDDYLHQLGIFFNLLRELQGESSSPLFPARPSLGSSPPMANGKGRMADSNSKTSLQRGSSPGSIRDVANSSSPVPGKLMIPDVRLTNIEISKYFGPAVLEQSRATGQTFFIQRLNPLFDNRFIEDWHQEFDRDTAWQIRWQQKLRGAIKLPLFPLLPVNSFGLISEMQRQETLQGYMGVSVFGVGDNPDTGEFIYRVRIPQMELYYRNVSALKQLPHVADLLFDYLIKTIKESGAIRGGIDIRGEGESNPGYNAFTKRRGAEEFSYGLGWPQQKVEEIYTACRLNLFFNQQNRVDEIAATLGKEKEYKGANPASSPADRAQSAKRKAQSEQNESQRYALCPMRYAII